MASVDERFMDLAIREGAKSEPVQTAYCVVRLLFFCFR